MGWADAQVSVGTFDRDEMDPASPNGGLLRRLPLHQPAMARIFGVRAPGLSPEMIDYVYFGQHPDVPPYVAEPWHESEASSARLGAWMGEVLVAEDLPRPPRRPGRGRRGPCVPARSRDGDRRGAGGPGPLLRAADPAAVRAPPRGHRGHGDRDRRPRCRRRRAGRRPSCPDPRRRASATSTPRCRPSPLGAQPPGPRVGRADGRLRRRVDGLRRASGGGGRTATPTPSGPPSRVRPGAREPRARTSGTSARERGRPTPTLALALIDRMRLADDDAAPAARSAANVAAREAATARVEEALAGEPAALASSRPVSTRRHLYLAGRERTKTTIITRHPRDAHGRPGARAATPRLLARRPTCMLLADELDAFVNEPDELARPPGGDGSSST